MKNENLELITRLSMDYTAPPTALSERIDDLAEWFTDNPNHSDIKEALTELLSDVLAGHKNYTAPKLTDNELTEMWHDAKRYANPTAADAHLRYARAIEAKVRGEA